MNQQGKDHSANVPTFGGPVLILVDQRHMQHGNKKDLIMISQGNAAWNAQKHLDFALENHENLNDYAVLNFETCLEQYLGNVNFQKPEPIAGLSDQHRQFFCWTDAVFAGLGHRSGGLFRRLTSQASERLFQSIMMVTCSCSHRG